MSDFPEITSIHTLKNIINSHVYRMIVLFYLTLRDYFDVTDTTALTRRTETIEKVSSRIVINREKKRHKSVCLYFIHICYILH